MAIKDYKKAASEILTCVGGSSNVSNSMNCMTRLRVTIKDSNKVNETGLKAISGVMQVIMDGSIVQIVLGPGVVKKVADEFSSMLTSNSTNEETSKLDYEADWHDNKAKIKEKQNKFGWLSRGMRHLANIFTPLIPAVIAAGLFAALASIVNQFGAGGVMSGTNSTKEAIALVDPTVKVFYYLFTAFNVGFTSYLTLACGYNAAKEFGASPMLGLMLGGICLAGEITEISKLIGLFNVDNSLASTLLAGKGGVIGVIAACWLLSVVEKFLHKHMPNSLDVVITPFISILLVGSVYVFGLMIVAGYISDGISWIIGQLTMSPYLPVRLIAGFFAAALFLPLVMMGMHHGLVAIYSVELATSGFVTLYPALAMAGAGQVGAAVALFIKAKKTNNSTIKRNISGSIIPGICGVGEPLIYSVTLPLGIPFLTAGLGAGLGGAFVMSFKVASTSWGPSGVIAAPLMTYVNGEPNFGLGVGLYFAGLLIAAIFGFIFTYFIVKKERLIPKEEASPVKVKN